MGLERIPTFYKCGCIHYYEYDECCGMGPVRGTEREYWTRCDFHYKEIREQENIIYDAKRKINEINHQIRYPKAEVEKPKEPETKRESISRYFPAEGSIEELIQKSNDWCKEVLPQIRAAKEAGKDFIEFQDSDDNPFDPQLSWDLIKQAGVEKFRYDRETKTIYFIF